MQRPCSRLILLGSFAAFPNALHGRTLFPHHDPLSAVLPQAAAEFLAAAAEAAGSSCGTTQPNTARRDSATNVTESGASGTAAPAEADGETIERGGQVVSKRQGQLRLPSVISALL